MRRSTFVSAVAVLGMALVALPARGLFHLAVIDEVVTSYGGDATAQFIEIRMLSGSQNFVAHTIFAAFDASGAYIGDILEVPSNVANGVAGGRWIVATSAFQTASGLTADFTMPSGILPVGGGMVCFGGGGGAVAQNPPTWSRTTFSNYVDCVAYGTYSGPLNGHIGTPTTVDGDGHSLQRVSQTNDNSVDFACSDSLTPTNNQGTTVTLSSTSPCPMPPPTPTPTAPPVFECPSTPDAGCTSGFAKSMLLAKDAPAGKEKLLVKMVGGPALTQTDFGDPLDAGGTEYRLCVYAGTALATTLDLARAGDTCGAAPCWKAIGGAPPNGVGYQFKDGAAASDGVLQVLYKAGAAGKSKAIVKGKGANLPDGIAGGLQSATAVTVQLHGSDAPQCLSVTAITIKKQTATLFKAQ
jgi:hypothetical protein